MAKKEWGCCSSGRGPASKQVQGRDFKPPVLQKEKRKEKDFVELPT
jgi:hypothetical protein